MALVGVVVHYISADRVHAASGLAVKAPLFLLHFGSYGHDCGAFDMVPWLTVNPFGVNLFTSDERRVQVFDYDGTFDRDLRIGLSEPRGLCMDVNGDLLLLSASDGWMQLHLISRSDEYETSAVIWKRKIRESTRPSVLCAFQDCVFIGAPDEPGVQILHLMRQPSARVDSATLTTNKTAAAAHATTASATESVRIEVKEGPRFGLESVKAFDGGAVDAKRRLLYITDSATHKLHVFDITLLAISADHDNYNADIKSGDVSVPSGRRVLATSTAFTGNADVVRLVVSIGGKGEAPGKFWHPYGVAVEQESGRVYVCDCSNHRVQAFAPGAETFLFALGGKGVQSGELTFPKSVAVAPDGRVYVSDCTHRISIF
jgi:hypothetical protein